MKRLLLLFASPTLVMGLTSLWFQVFPAQGPPPMGAYYMSGGVWTKVPSTGTFVPSPPVFGSAGPPPIGLYCYNSGLAEWVAADSSCLGGGGGGGGITALTGDVTASGSGSVAATVVHAPASGITGATLASNVLSSSLTSLGGGTVGTAAFQNTGTSGANIPLLNGTNTYSGPSSFTGAGAVSTAQLLVNGTWFVAGSATTNYPALYVKAAGATDGALNTAGNGVVINAPSGYPTNADLISGQINGGALLFHVLANGVMVSSGGYAPSSNLVGIGTTSPGVVKLYNVGGVMWSSTGAYTGTIDLTTCRSAAGVFEVGASTGCASTGAVLAANYQAGILYSAAGTALPSCVAGLKGTTAMVSDATTPTYLGTYTSGGAVTAAVLCNGSTWVTH